MKQTNESILVSLTKEMDRSTYRPVQVDWCASCNDLVENELQ